MTEQAVAWTILVCLALPWVYIFGGKVILYTALIAVRLMQDFNRWVMRDF